MFSLGVVVGILLSVIFFATSVYLNHIRKNPVQIIPQRIENLARAKGSIYEPKDDLSFAREEILQKNKMAGIDTNLTELYDE